MNFTARPDVVSFAVRTTAGFMIAIPDDGPDAFNTDFNRIKTYRTFIRSVAGLVGIERFDLIGVLVREFSTQHPELLVVEPRSTDLEAYLHPLHGRSSLDVATRVVVAAVAVIISIAAVVVPVVR